MTSSNSPFSFGLPLSQIFIEDFASSLDLPFELEDQMREIDSSIESPINSMTLGLRSQFLTSPKAINIISWLDEQPQQTPSHQNECRSSLIDLKNVQVDEFSLKNDTQKQGFEKDQGVMTQEQTLQKTVPNNNHILHHQAFEEITTAEPFRHYPEIHSKDIQKAPFNFGKTALGSYMIKLIRKGKYDKFIKEILQRDENFIQNFKEFCRKVNYKTRNDFKFVWSISDFQASNNTFYNYYVALKKVTKQFLKTDVSIWIETKTKRKDYIPIYERCAEVYLQGIENVENFDFAEFSYPVSYFMNYSHRSV